MKNLIKRKLKAGQTTINYRKVLWIEICIFIIPIVNQNYADIRTLRFLLFLSYITLKRIYFRLIFFSFALNRYLFPF